MIFILFNILTDFFLYHYNWEIPGQSFQLSPLGCYLHDDGINIYISYWLFIHDFIKEVIISTVIEVCNLLCIQLLGLYCRYIFNTCYDLIN